jgi:hypothetical protein
MDLILNARYNSALQQNPLFPQVTLHAYISDYEYTSLCRYSWQIQRFYSHLLTIYAFLLLPWSYCWRDNPPLVEGLTLCSCRYIHITLMFVYEALIRFLDNTDKILNITFLKSGGLHFLFTHKILTNVGVTWSDLEFYPSKQEIRFTTNTAPIKYRHELITYAHTQHIEKPQYHLQHFPDCQSQCASAFLLL